MRHGRAGRGPTCIACAWACPEDTVKGQEVGTLCPQWVLQARQGHTGRLPPGPSSTAGISGSSIHPRQVGPRFAQSSLWTEELEKTQSYGAAFKKALKAKETGPVPRAEVTRSQRSLLCKKNQAAEVCIPGSPVPPHKLSLLDVVLVPSSASRSQSRRSQLSGAPPSAPSIQGWAAIWSREGRSEGRRDRHHSMSC